MRGSCSPVRVAVVLATALAAGACGGDSSPTSPGPGTPPADPRLTPPVPESPVGDAQLGTLRPTFTVRNGTSDQAGSRTYEFHVSDRSDFSAGPTSFIASFNVVVSGTGVSEGGGGTTSFTPGEDLQPTTRMYWRARMRQGSTVSEWSPASTFRTKLVGFSRPGELYDPLIHSETIGTPVGSTTWIPDKGIRINNANSWVRYPLQQTITDGEFSVEVEGLYPDSVAPNNGSTKWRVFSMMDGGNSLFNSKFLANVQYRGTNGNPDNAISWKAVFGDSDFQIEPDRGQRTAGVRILNPSTTYLWKATWGSEFRLQVFEGGVGGTQIYNFGKANGGVYSPVPHVAYLGANDAAQESGAWAGAIYRNVWIGNRPRPESLGSALQPLR
jgi:hypothetical protein